LVARLPLLSEECVLTDLDSDDDETVLRAIQAVSVLRVIAGREGLRRLGQHARDPLRTAARSVLTGLPDPPRQR
jgi:hypothetical protein